MTLPAGDENPKRLQVVIRIKAMEVSGKNDDASATVQLSDNGA
jgi:hypothetical protein